MFKLGEVALWNLVTRRRSIDANDETLEVFRVFAPELWERMLAQAIPATMEADGKEA